MHNSGAEAQSITQLVPGGGARLAHLSNDELLAQTRCLAGKANQVLAALLEHLGEVEARGIHRLERCASLYTYCIYELRFSEDAASRRASAARLVPQFPAALELDEPQLYQMQFTTTEEHAELVEKAKALLSHASPQVTLGELHLQAMRLLVEALEKKRFGAERPARAVKAPRQRGRAIPAAIRREVYERDEGRCTFTDEHGARCAETHLTQFHHLVPFAKGGTHTTGELTLRCAAHNALAAEQDL